jgi:hypothetical protein
MVVSCGRASLEWPRVSLLLSDIDDSHQSIQHHDYSNKHHMRTKLRALGQYMHVHIYI